MKASVGAVSVAFLLALLPIAAQAASVKFCVERLEENGSINIYPVDLMMDGRKAATLVAGGAKACATAMGPTAKVSLRWHAFDWERPDHGLANPRMEDSKPVTFVMSHGKAASLAVCALRVQGGTPHWIIVTRKADCPPV